MNKKGAIKFLTAKLRELRNLETLPYNNNDYPLWREVIAGVLREVFGDDSTEYFRFVKAYQRVSYKGENKQQKYLKELEAYKAAIKLIIGTYEANKALRRLSRPIKTVKTDKTDKTEPKGAAKSPIQLFDSLQFHSRVIEASRELFKDGHYRDAIYRAFVEVNNFVKSKASSQLDGKKLMSTVFSLDNPIIKLNQLETQTDKDEQEGFMFLFMGAMQGIRNPKAHENIIQDNPYIALKLIGFASLLIQTIDFWKAGKS